MKKLFILLIILPLLSFNSNFNSDYLIGRWIGKDKGQIGFIIFDKEGYATFEIDGQVIGGKEFVLNGKKGEMTYEVNVGKEPIEIDFTLTKIESNESKKMLCIAKFEDENNMILAMDFNSERPTEFNKKKSIKLKRIE